MVLPFIFDQFSTAERIFNLGLGEIVRDCNLGLGETVLDRELDPMPLALVLARVISEATDTRYIRVLFAHTTWHSQLLTYYLHTSLPHVLLALRVYHSTIFSSLCMLRILCCTGSNQNSWPASMAY